MALCAIADAMYEFEQEDEARGLASLTVGSVSETYNRPAGAVRHHPGPARRPLPARGRVLPADRAVAAPCVTARSSAVP